MISSVNALINNGLSVTSLLQLFGISSTPNSSTSISPTVPNVSAATTASISSNTIQAILDSAETTTGPSASTTAGQPGWASQLGWGHNNTLQQAEQLFYENLSGNVEVMDHSGNVVAVEPGYVSEANVIGGSAGAAFEQAYLNHTLQFTSTSAYPQLDYRETDTPVYGPNGNVAGQTSNVTYNYEATLALSKQLNFIMSTPYGYKGGGADAGLIISW